MSEDDARRLERLRKKAERAIQEHEASGRQYAQEEVQAIVQELHVYQTELEMQNETLQRSKSSLSEMMKKYYDLYNFAPIGFITMDEELTIREANLTFSKMMGLDVRDVVSKKLPSFVIADSQDELYLHARSVLRSKGKQSSEITLKGGNEVAVRIISIAEEEQGRYSIRSALLDLTDILSLQRSNTELQRFAYIASHDLREPLRMISSYLDLLIRNYEGKLLDSKAKEYLHFSIDAADRMQQMINDLLAYAKIDSQGMTLERVQMENVLATALKDLRTSIEKSGAVVTHEPLPTIQADKGQMVLLLVNLLANAIKFRDEKVPRIHISATFADNEALFTVRDNGIGIDPRYKDRLFNMFQRLHTREEYEGTGMGLAISRRIVEQHGGKIWFESEPGEGATFFFTIPEWKDG